MLQATPTISVVMPVYNAADYLPAAVDSILAQTFREFELIAIDDGSTDGSLEVLRRFADHDPRLHIVSRPNTGVVGALNEGVAMAHGEFIARMDADDIALPHRFDRQLGFLRSQPACVAVGSAVLQVDSDGDPICIQSWAETHEEIDQMLLQGSGGLAHPTAMTRTDVMREAGGYRAEYQWVEDKDLWLRLAEIGRLANLREPLLKYRLHAASVCWQREAEQRRLLESLLAETYRRRGIEATPPRLASIRRRNDNVARARAKWVRAAARSGNYRTAVKHARQLLHDHPLQLSTWLALLRASAAAGAPHQRAGPSSAPDGVAR